MHSGIQTAAWLFPVLVLLALALEPLARRLKLPFAALLVLAGFIGSELITGAGVDLGLRWQHFRDLVLYVLVPIFVFASALTLDARALARHLPTILLLAIPVFLLSTAITATLLYLGIANAEGFPVITALVAATIVAATDPSAVIQMLQAHKVSPALIIKLEGESLFNDGLAIVLYNVLLSGMLATTASDAGMSVAAVVLEFLRVFLGGALVGALMGGIAYLAFRLYTQDTLRAALTVAVAYLSFATAEGMGGMSGVMAALVSGVILGIAVCRSNAEFVKTLWGFIAFIAAGVAFLLVGVTITTSLFTHGWLAMAIGVFAAFLGRAVSVYAAVPVMEHLPGVERMSWYERRILIGAGQRGAVTAALALSLPTTLPGWWTAQAIGYGVVLFTLFVQGPLFAIVLKRG